MAHRCQESVRQEMTSIATTGQQRGKPDFEPAAPPWGAVEDEWERILIDMGGEG